MRTLLIIIPGIFVIGSAVCLERVIHIKRHMKRMKDFAKKVAERDSYS